MSSGETPFDSSHQIAQLRDGDISAFEAIYRVYAPPLASVAATLLHSHDAAEDVVQDIFFRLWINRETLTIQTADELRFYLFRALRNRVQSDWRHAHVVHREHTAAETHDTPIAMGEREVPADEALHAATLDRALAAATARLAPRAQLALTLRLRHQMTNAEIGKVLDISEQAAAKLISRAREALRAVWDRYQA